VQILPPAPVPVRVMVASVPVCMMVMASFLAGRYEMRLVCSTGLFLFSPHALDFAPYAGPDVRRKCGERPSIDFIGVVGRR
jgi:hypothetical protein